MQNFSGVCNDIEVGCSYFMHAIHNQTFVLFCLMAWYKRQQLQEHKLQQQNEQMI
jgi:hypothetical protein